MTTAITEAEGAALHATLLQGGEQWVVAHGQLAERTAAAALQDMLMAPRVADLHHSKGPGKLRMLHAVGVDVVKLFLSPAKNARTGREMALGYAEVFDDDKPELSKAIAALLAEAIWFGLQEDIPLLLLPPIDGQLERIVAAIGSDAQRPNEGARRQIERIRERLARHQTRLTPKNVEVLWKATVADGPGAELERLKRLLDKHRLCTPDSQLAVQKLASLVARLGGASSRELGFLNDRTNYWTNKLSKLRGIFDYRNDEELKKGRKKPPSGAIFWKVRESAEAMARLELINQRLKNYEPEPSRLVYITADTPLFMVGRDYVPANETEDFATLFLRHPRAYLGEPGVLAPSDGGAMGSSLADLMTIWLGDFSPTRKSFHLVFTGTWRVHLLKSVQDRIKWVEDRDSEAYGRMLSQWDELTQNVRLPPRSMLEVLEASATAGSHSFDELLEKFRPEIEEKFNKVFNNLFDTITELRFAITFTAPHGPRERPSICFEKHNEMTSLFQAADLWKENGFDREIFQKHRDDIVRNDQSGYFLNLAHAWLLASFGHWVSAAIFARRAISAVGVLNPQAILRPDNPNGREAAYLLAVCLRHAAKGTGDLVESRDWLDKAEDIAKREILGAYDPDQPPDIVHERFTAERFSNRLTEFLFDWTASPSTENPKACPPAMRQCAEQSFELAAEILRFIDDGGRGDRNRAEDSAGIPADMPPLSHRNYLRRQTARRLLRNALGIALMVPYDHEMAEAAWKCLNQLSQGKKSRSSGFGEFQDLCAKALFGSSPAFGYTPRSEREKDLATLEEQRRVLEAYREDPGQRDDAPEWVAQLLVFPYDVDRFLSWIHTVQKNAN